MQEVQHEIASQLHTQLLAIADPVQRLQVRPPTQRPKPARGARPAPGVHLYPDRTAAESDRAGPAGAPRHRRVGLPAFADAHVDQRQVRAAVRRPRAPRRRPAGLSLVGWQHTGHRGTRARGACLPAGVGGRAGAPTLCVLEASGLGPTGPCAARAGSTCARGAAARAVAARRAHHTSGPSSLCVRPRARGRSHQRFARRIRARPHAGCMRRCARPPLRRTRRTTRAAETPGTKHGALDQPCRAPFRPRRPPRAQSNQPRRRAADGSISLSSRRTRLGACSAVPTATAPRTPSTQTRARVRSTRRLWTSQR